MGGIPLLFVHKNKFTKLLPQYYWIFSLWNMGGTNALMMKAELVCDALKMALWQRKPGRGVIVHSDRGVQYASKSYRALLTTHGCVGSMSKKGDCWDNGVPRIIYPSG
jgi:putative transposase